MTTGSKFGEKYEKWRIQDF